MGKTKKNRRVFRWVMLITLWTFFLAVVLGLVAQLLLSRIEIIGLAFAILLAVVILGIVFDMVGTAAAAASEAPLNAKAARKVDGARRGVYLIQHAEQVANFCNDVVGDISGIVSGTLGALIALRLVLGWRGSQNEVLISILLTAAIAAVTVGGKAWGKAVALNRSTEIILFAGKVITRLEKLAVWLKLRGRQRR